MTIFGGIGIMAVGAILIIMVPVLFFFYTVILLDTSFIDLYSKYNVNVKKTLRKVVLIVMIVVAVALGVFNYKVIVPKIVRNVAIEEGYIIGVTNENGTEIQIQSDKELDETLCSFITKYSYRYIEGSAKVKLTAYRAYWFKEPYIILDYDMELIE